MKFFALLSFIMLLAGGCHSLKTTGKNDISYVLAQNYFIKNTYVDSGVIKVDNQAALDSIFGIGRTMAESSQPTAIDFSKYFAIAVIAPTSNKNNNIIINKLMLSANGIMLNYKIQDRGIQGYTSKHFQLLIIDKQYNKPLIVMKE